METVPRPQACFKSWSGRYSVTRDWKLSTELGSQCSVVDLSSVIDPTTDRNSRERARGGGVAKQGSGWLSPRMSSGASQKRQSDPPVHHGLDWRRARTRVVSRKTACKESALQPYSTVYTALASRKDSFSASRCHAHIWCGSVGQVNDKRMLRAFSLQH